MRLRHQSIILDNSSKRESRHHSVHLSQKDPPADLFGCDFEAAIGKGSLSRISILLSQRSEDMGFAVFRYRHQCREWYKPRRILRRCSKLLASDPCLSGVVPQSEARRSSHACGVSAASRSFVLARSKDERFLLCKI